MSIATELQNYATYLGNAYNKASSKGATIPAHKNLQNLTNCIDSIPTGTVEVPSKDVDFIDYDGTILYSYTATEFANLTALPANPTHDGLTSMGWNWTLADAKTFVANSGFLDIGATYKTTDGKTHVYVELTNQLKEIRVGLMFFSYASVNIDWGDATPASTVSNPTSNQTFLFSPHTYANAGSYCIKIEVVSGEIAIQRQNYNFCELIAKPLTDTGAESYAGTIKKVEVGLNTHIKTYAFGSCTALETIVLSATEASSLYNKIESYTFNYTVNLKALVLPSGFTALNSYSVNYSGIKRMSCSQVLATIGQYGLQYNFSLERLSFPSAVNWGSSYAFRQCRNMKKISLLGVATTINNYCFNTCPNLIELKIPAGTTSIGTYVFYACNGLQKLDFSSATTVPTLSNINSFTNTSSTLKIIVPDSLYASWIATGSWADSSIVGKIVKASEV